MRLRPIALAVITSFVLAGCGVRGSLKTPPPLWGDKDKPKVEQPADNPKIPNDFPEAEDDGPRSPY